jgi:hypothetical protein
MIIVCTFKVDDTEEPELAKWLNSFSKKGRVRSYHIRQAIKAYINGGAVPSLSVPVVPVLPGSPPGPGVVPHLEIVTGGIITENPGQQQEKNEADILALLDSQF